MKQLCRLVLIVVALSSLGNACLNDRDSLYFESVKSRDTLKIVVGWFPVHTREYYTMRIERSLKEIEEHPDRLLLYDDVAVAYDRIGDSEKAIEVIERKRTYMVEHEIKERKVTESDAMPSEQQIKEFSLNPWYRYYANAGTFWAHRWFRSGMPEEHKKEWLDRAQNYIDKAIELNPYAHNLREYAQAEVLRWVREGEPGQTLYDFGSEYVWLDDESMDALAGLIDLGNAWESVDVYHTLASYYTAFKKDDYGYFIFQRVKELQDDGKRSLTGQVFAAYEGAPKIPTDVEEDYARLRKAAEKYREDYLAYESELLKMGKHPDTDPDFWANYEEPKFPDYGRYSLTEGIVRGVYLIHMVIGFFIITTIAFVIVSVRKYIRAGRVN